MARTTRKKPANKEGKEYMLQDNMTKPPLEWVDIQTLWNDHRDWLHAYITEMYKNYFMYAQDRKSQLEKDKESWRSNLKSPLTNMFTSWIYNMLQDSDLRFVCSSTKQDKRKAAQNILDIVWYCMEQADFNEALWSAIFDQCLLGWGIFKTSYMYYEDEFEYINLNGQKVKWKSVEDYTTVRYVSPYNLFTLASTNRGNNRMMFERRLIPSKYVRREYSKFNLEPKLQEIEKDGVRLDEKDYEAIKINMPFFNTAEGRDITKDDTYNTKDKMFEVIEWHTEKTISIWINGIYHWTFEQLWPGLWMKYHFLSFKKNPGTWKWIWVGYIVKPIQEAYDEILNLRLDNVKLAMNKMFFMEASSSLFGQTPVMKIKPGAIYKVRDIDALKEIEVSEVKTSAYTELDTMFQMVQGLTGVGASVIWMQQKVERTATWAEMIKNAADAQTKQPTRSIVEEMGKLAKEIATLCLTYMSKDTIRKICWEDEEFSQLSLEDLVNGFDFEFEMTSNGTLTKSIQNEQLMQLLDKQDKTIDINWRQVLDVREIVGKLVETMNIGIDWILSEEEAEQAQKRYNEVQAQQQQELQAAQWQAQWAAADVQQAMGGEGSSVAWQPGAGTPVEMMPNPEGINAPQA